MEVMSMVEVAPVEVGRAVAEHVVEGVAGAEAKKGDEMLWVS